VINRFGVDPFACVPDAAGWLVVAVIADVIGQLDLQRALHQPLGQLAEQTTGANDLLLSPSSRQQLIHDIVRQLAAQVIRHAVKDPRRGRRRLAWRLAAGSLSVRDPRSIDTSLGC
jgi:hypothetical protein